MSYRFSLTVIAEYFDVLLLGLLTTIEFTAICIVMGSLLGFVISIMRVSRSRLVRIVSTAYVEFFRGTPVLVQLFWIFFCLPIVLGVEISNFASSVIALTLFMGAAARTPHPATSPRALRRPFSWAQKLQAACAHRAP